jgi:hypothetical protein
MDSDFEKANKKVHKVEDQWHYKYLTKYGFKPIDMEGVGFVRSYEYKNGDHSIVCTTGVSADYWSDKTTPKLQEDVYWSGLEPHLKKLVELGKISL